MKNITEYINEGTITDSFKTLFNKFQKFLKGDQIDFNNKVHLSTKLFGELKRLPRRSQVNEHDIAINKCVFDEDRFEIWHMFKTEDKYGDKVTGLELLGMYDGEKEELEYVESLTEYIDKKYFEGN